MTLSELKQIVKENDKQRFSIIPNPPSNDGMFEASPSDSEDPAAYLIRANQGHSIVMDSASLLTPITDENAPETVVHGTFYGAWPLILLAGGLSKMGRNHIHFALGVPGGAKPVISGMRADAQVLMYVDVRKALGAGVKFWRSENEVVLSEGDGRGMVGLEFVRRVEERKEGLGVLWEEGRVVKELPEKLAGRGVPRGKNKGLKAGRGGREGEKGRVKDNGADGAADGTINKSTAHT